MSNFDIHLYVHLPPDMTVTAALSRIEAIVSATSDELTKLKAELDDFVATTLAANRALLQALNQIIADLKANPGDETATVAAIKALEDQVTTIKQTLAADDTANTPPQ